MKQAAAQARLDWPAVQSIYREERSAAQTEHDRLAGQRKTCLEYLGYKGRTAETVWRNKYRRAIANGADLDCLRRLDDVAHELARTIMPDLPQENPSAAVWDIVSGEPPTMETAAETFARALDRARSIAPEAAVSPDDMMPVPVAAAAMVVTEQWARKLLESGRLVGRKIGGRWVAYRDSVESFVRHPTAGRPRLETVPF
jgi:hypothetical protein